MIYSIKENWNWDYDDACEWMQKSHEHCFSTGDTFFGLGAHAKDIVTLGRHADTGDVLNREALRTLNVGIISTDRGGGATLHGPGQIVLYPIISIEALSLSIPEVTFALESTIIACLSDFAISSHRIPGHPGIYVNDSKIGSVGFRVSRGILTHGISLNVSNQLSLYEHIVTCKKVNAAITSMAALVGENVDIRSVGRRLLKHTISNLGLD